MPPVQPMLAKSVKGIPDPEKFGGLSFEPKWDGFRCLVFRDGDEVELTSRNTKPLTRYFPEVVAAIREQLPERCVLDGELFVRRSGRQLRVRDAPGADPPRRSRGSDMLAEKTPASYVAFDLLALGDESYVDRPFAERRAAAGGGARPASTGPCYLTRTTTDPAAGRGVVQPVRGRRARRRGRQAARRAVPAERPHDAQDQARAHRRRRGRRLPRAQDHHAGAAAARQPAARPVRRRQAAAHRRQRELHRGPPRRADRGAAAAGVRHQGPPLGRVGGVGDRQPRPRARHPEPVERRARTSRSRRCGPSGCSRSATTTWRAGASGTPRSSSAGAPTATPSRAATSSWRSRSRYDLARILGVD